MRGGSGAGRQPVALRAAALLALAALLLGCDSSRAAGPGADSAPTPDTQLSIANCDQVPCTGTLGGARYEIRLPATWNGTLLLWSHGYRASVRAPSSREILTHPESAPSAEVADTLLSQGYALAGSGYSRSGWAVTEGVTAGEQLYHRFVTLVGKPRRTYVWGASLGGLITQLLAEKNPDWISGSAPVCGVLAGANHSLDLALDVTYAIKTLLYPQLKLARYASAADARAAFDGAYKAIATARRDQRDGVPKLMLIAALVDAAAASPNEDGHDATSRLNATVASLATATLYSTVLRWEVEQRAGGNPSSNLATDYSARVTVAEAAAPQVLSPGSVARNLALLAQGQRVSPEPAARRAAASLGSPSGTLHDPTVTMHTTVDPLVVVQNESAFRTRVAGASGGGTAKLLQVYIGAPNRYTNAPYGAGHCSFTARHWAAVVAVLDLMVRQGKRPTDNEITKVFGADSGLALDFVPPPWPTAID